MTYYRSLPPVPPRKRRLSRRELLILGGMLGGGMAMCVCGTTFTAILLLNYEREDNVEEIVTSTTNSQPPDYAYPKMIRRAAWGAKQPDHTAKNEYGFRGDENPGGWLNYGDDLTGIFTTVVVHHSVLYEGDDVSTMHEIQRLHQEDNGWADVGYHYVVGKQGAVYEARDIHARGVHVASYNSGTVGVCLMGNFMEEQPTDVQINSARDLIQWLAEKLELTHLETHRAFNPTTQCPGDNLAKLASAFAANAGLEVGIDGYEPPDETE